MSFGFDKQLHAYSTLYFYNDTPRQYDFGSVECFKLGLHLFHPFNHSFDDLPD